MSFDRRLDKDGVVHVYTGEHYAAIRKGEILPFVTTQMDLESIILSKISQTERGKNHVTSLVCRI